MISNFEITKSAAVKAFCRNEKTKTLLAEYPSYGKIRYKVSYFDIV